MTRRLGTTVALVMAAAPSAAAAQSQQRVSADVSTTAGYQNNPFAVLGDDTGSALVAVDFAPRYQRLTERSTLTLSADANLQQYLRRYGGNDSYSAAVDYAFRPSSRVTGHGRVDVASSVLGAASAFLPSSATNPILPFDPIGQGAVGGGAIGGIGGVGTDPAAITPAIGLVPITDIGLFGLRNRRKSARASGDAAFSLSQRDSLTVNAYAEAARYSNLGFGNYEAYSAGAGYSRRVSDRVTLGLRGTGSRYNYNTAGADSRVYSVEATGSAILNARWTLDGSLGVSFVDGESSLSTRQTSLSGSLNLCRRAEFSSMCAQLSRQVSPTGIAGTQYVTAAGLNWVRRLSERDNVSLNGTYSKVGGDVTRLVTGGVPLQTEFVQVGAGYDRQLGERLRFVASANYRQLLNGNQGRPKDFGGQVGLSYRIGDRR